MSAAPVLEEAPTSSPENDVVVVDEEVINKGVGAHLGMTKWFSAKLGFGFITIQSGDDVGKDVFVHHTGIRPLNSNYKTLLKGEYVNFNIVESPNGRQAVDVTGVGGGPLMCDHVGGQAAVTNGGSSSGPAPSPTRPFSARAAPASYHMGYMAGFQQPHHPTAFMAPSHYRYPYRDNGYRVMTPPPPPPAMYRRFRMASVPPPGARGFYRKGVADGSMGSVAVQHVHAPRRSLPGVNRVPPASPALSAAVRAPSVPVTVA